MRDVMRTTGWIALSEPPSQVGLLVCQSWLRNCSLTLGLQDDMLEISCVQDGRTVVDEYGHSFRLRGCEQTPF